VTIDVWLVDPAIQSLLDERHGDGLVRLRGLLQPLKGDSD